MGWWERAARQVVGETLGRRCAHRSAGADTAAHARLAPTQVAPRREENRGEALLPPGFASLPVARREPARSAPDVPPARTSAPPTVAPEGPTIRPGGRVALRAPRSAGSPTPAGDAGGAEETD